LQRHPHFLKIGALHESPIAAGVNDTVLVRQSQTPTETQPLEKVTKSRGRITVIRNIDYGEEVYTSNDSKNECNATTRYVPIDAATKPFRGCVLAAAIPLDGRPDNNHYDDARRSI
jgi:hypothetical protein